MKLRFLFQIICLALLGANYAIGQPQAAAERVRAEAQAATERARVAKEFPYYAVITCNLHGRVNLPLFQCMRSSAGIETSLELRNGSEYDLYKYMDMMSRAPGKVNEQDQSTQIDLRNKFTLKIQNASKDMVLGVVVRSRKNNEILFEKKVDLWGTILVSN